MNVHHLELFYYVAKYEGITAAVRKMPYGIQQPAVSGQILQLEEALDVKLFNRRPFSLTPAGEELYDFIYPFFSKLGQIEERLKGEEAKHLRVAASAAVLRNHLPEVLSELQNVVSNLKLTLREIEPSDVHSCVISQQADVAISILHGNLTDGLHAEELLRLDMVLYVPSDWQVDTWEDLLVENDEGKGFIIDKPLIGLPEHESLSQLFDRALGEREVLWPVSVEVNSLDVIQNYVMCGLGAGIGTRIPGVKLNEGVRALPLHGFPPLVIGAIYQGKLKPVAEAFLSIAKKKAKQLASG